MTAPTSTALIERPKAEGTAMWSNAIAGGYSGSIESMGKIGDLLREAAAAIAAHEAERQELRAELKAARHVKERMMADREHAEAATARLREALELFAPGSHDGLWGRIKAHIVEGAASRAEGIRIARQITEWQVAVNDALHATAAAAPSRRQVRDALAGIVGLIQLVERNGVGATLLNNHRYIEALAVLDELDSQTAAPVAAAPVQPVGRLREMFAAGVKVARDYGDNAHHLEGDQLERQFQIWLTRVVQKEGSHDAD